MRVHVDEPRRQDEAVGVDATAGGLTLADRRDAPVTDDDVGGDGGCTGAVDHTRSADREPGHAVLLRRSGLVDSAMSSPAYMSAAATRVIATPAATA